MNLLASIHGLEQFDHLEQHDAIHLGELKQEYNQIVQTLRCQRHGNNSFDPLIKFPSEIWIPIIQYAMDGIPRVDRVPSPTTLCSCVSVSNRWHKYITEAPVLWSNIDLNDGGSNGQDTAVLLATFLHFSQAHELNIAISIPLASWESIRDRIAMHRSRIRSIVFYSLSGYFQMESFVSYKRDAN